MAHVYTFSNNNIDSDIPLMVIKEEEDSIEEHIRRRIKNEFGFYQDVYTKSVEN